MYYMFLDDERNPSDVFWLTLPKVDWVIVRTQAEFKSYVSEYGMMKFVSFDNDLGNDPDGKSLGEGRWCAKWLVEQLLDGAIEFNPDFEYMVHSQNIIAAKAITGLLDPYLEFRRNNQTAN